MPRTVRARSAFKRRPYARRGKSMRKTYFKKPRYSRVKRAKQFRRFAQRIARVGAERKRFDLTITDTAFSSVTTKEWCLTSGISQGTTNSTRIGETIQCVGDIRVNFTIRYPISTADEANTGYGNVAYKQNIFHFWLFQDDRSHTIGATGGYAPPTNPTVRSVLKDVNAAGQWAYAWPRDRDIKIIAHKMVVFDIDDRNGLQREERNFVLTANLKNHLIKWYDTTTTARSKGHIWLMASMDRLLIDGSTVPVPVEYLMQVQSEFSYVDV